MIAGADAVVTSYTLLRLDFESYGALPWAGLVLDEAQYVKNHHSKAHACARKVDAPFKVAITGTPMENNLMELWSLLSITALGLFPNPERFKEYYARPIEKGANTELRPAATPDPAAHHAPHQGTGRRRPAEKQEQILEVELHPRHSKLYQTHLQRERQKVLGLLGDVNRDRFAILRSLTLLRQLALHAAWWTTRTATCRPPRSTPTARAARRRGGRRPSGTGLQPVHPVPADGTRPPRGGRVPCCYLDGSTVNRPAVISGFEEGPHRCSSSASRPAASG